MKRIFNIGALLLAVAGATVMSSCSDEFIEDKSCSRCTKSKRLDSGAYECMERLYDIVDKTCFVPKKEDTD